MQLTNIQNTAYFLAHDNYAMDCFVTLRSEQTIEPKNYGESVQTWKDLWARAGIYENIGTTLKGG